LWAIARYDLKLPEDEIGQLTFLEYFALLKRKHMEDDRARLNAGYIYAAIHNTAYGDPNREAVQPSDIVPSMREDKHDLTGRSGDEVKAMIFSVFGGKVVTH
jgi:hypothetical protein